MARDPTETPVSMENLRATIRVQDGKNEDKFAKQTDVPDVQFATNEEIKKALFMRGA